MSGPIELAVLDMAGTTVSDDGVVMAAFEEALSELGVRRGSAAYERAGTVVRQTMGQSKIEVFRKLFSESRAQQANRAFEDGYAQRVAAGEVTAVPGAGDLLRDLRARGIKVCLTTGFSVQTRELLCKRLGWTGLVDLALSPADVGRGRPYPDLIWAAMLTLKPGGVDRVLVAGDTASDMRAAQGAGATLRCGVVSGIDPPSRLREAGATHVIERVTDLPTLW